MMAVRFKKYDIITALLHLGADAGVYDASGHTALHLAVQAQGLGFRPKP
jgi:ankyrin repeat protein